MRKGYRVLHADEIRIAYAIRLRPNNPPQTQGIVLID